MHSRVRGSSLVELVLVVAVILTVTASAIPSVLRSSRTYELNYNADYLAGLLKRTRSEAVRLNTSVTCRIQQRGNTWVFWADLNNNGGQDPNEPVAILSGPAQLLPAGVAPDPTSTGYPNVQIPPGTITFDSRGAVTFGAAAPAVYALYLGYPGEPTYGYRAVTVLPSGTTEIWKASAYGPWHNP